MLLALTLIAICSLVQVWIRIKFFSHIFELLQENTEKYQSFLAHHFAQHVLTNRHWLGLGICSAGALAIPYFGDTVLILGSFLWYLIFSPFQYLFNKEKRNLTSQLNQFAKILWIIIFLVYLLMGILASLRSSDLMWGLFLLGLLVIDVFIPYFIFQRFKHSKALQSAQNEISTPLSNHSSI